jgi:hypothetical protein
VTKTIPYPVTVRLGALELADIADIMARWRAANPNLCRSDVIRLALHHGLADLRRERPLVRSRSRGKS